MDSDSKILGSSDSLAYINCTLTLSLTLIIHHLLKSPVLTLSPHLSGMRDPHIGGLTALLFDEIYF